MGYAIYQVGDRWGGYGVPTYCEHPDCNEKIDRGMSFACGGEPFSEVGCDRYFCSKHREFIGFNEEGLPCKHRKDCECEWKEVCERCAKSEPPFDYKPEHPTWIKHILKDKSWAQWRKKNPKKVAKLKSPTQ